jgi:hypothetical protein
MKCQGNPPLEATDPEEVEVDDHELEQLVGVVETLVAEYNSGRPFVASELEPWEWKGVVAWRRFSDLYDRAQTAKLVSLLARSAAPGPPQSKGR